jgi:hypothetical protein
MLRLMAVAAVASALWAGMPSLVAGAPGAQPAQADACLQLDAWYYTAGGTQNYVTPWAPGSCVGPNLPGWAPFLDPHASADEEWLPTPTKGVGFTSIVPSP